MGSLVGQRRQQTLAFQKRHACLWTCSPEIRHGVPSFSVESDRRRTDASGKIPKTQEKEKSSSSSESAQVRTRKDAHLEKTCRSQRCQGSSQKALEIGRHSGHTETLRENRDGRLQTFQGAGEEAL